MNAGSFRRIFVALIAVLAMAVLASSASAKTEDIIADSPVPPQGEPTAANGWQAGTCTKDSPVCSVDTPNQFFETSAAHPQVGFTQFIVENKPPRENAGGRPEDRSRRPAGRAERQPAGDPAVHTGRIRRGRLQIRIESGRECGHRVVARCGTRSGPRRHRSARLQHRTPARPPGALRHAPRRQCRVPAKRTSLSPATTTRASRSPCRNCRSSAKRF